MRELYQAFEAESQKPGKAFHELVRRRRRELGLAVPPEERVVPFRSVPSPSLPAIDLVIDRDEDGPADPGLLALLRSERRLEELDTAIDAATHHASPIDKRKLEEAFEHELHTYEALE